MEDAYARSVSEVLEFFTVDPTKGLTDSQVAEHGRLYGNNGSTTVPNTFQCRCKITCCSHAREAEEVSPGDELGIRALTGHREHIISTGLPGEDREIWKACFGGSMEGTGSTPFWRLVLKQFDDLLVKILIAAAVVSFFLALANGETGLSAFLEPSVILMILAANAAVGVITETNAEKALEELRAYQADVATVLRNGWFSILPAADLVPGDIVEVSGESCSVEKELDATNVTNAVYQDKTNILFSGTVVVAGRARAVVIGVGSNTAMGSIRDAMLKTEDEVTPLKKKLDEFGTFLAKVIAGICILVWIVNIGHFRDPAHVASYEGHYIISRKYLKVGLIFPGYAMGMAVTPAESCLLLVNLAGIEFNCFLGDVTMIAVALAVAAIPEGLPAVVTTCLALGTKRMARLNAIVRSLPSVETLGCTTVICSDKTVSVLQSAYDVPVVAEYSVSGTTYAPKLETPANLHCLLHTAMCSALCNESFIQYNPEKRNYEKIGESTEVALRVLAEKIGLPGFDSMPSALNMLSKHERASYCNRYWRVNSKRKQIQIMFSKGAPESVLPRCTDIMCNNDGSSIRLTPEIRSEIESKFQSFAGKETLRCLALALKRMPLGQQALSFDDEKDLTFIGLVGMLDPPREEVRNAILACMTAGIRVIVVTGDNKATAESLCQRIGAFDNLDDFEGLSYTASEFEKLPALQKTVALQRMTIFTRVEPSHKRMLVEALQHQNEVVAMTGDGVNDAPALKKADIGIAMGSGTAVAKSASDMVLADDNFATIVA
ncbi:UNVERIFIED_CONTAM: Calcium-transporting ATPase 3, endoplasmic reticulum-type, partial [Sesamum angustifolium]